MMSVYKQQWKMLELPCNFWGCITANWAVDLIHIDECKQIIYHPIPWWMTGPKFILQDNYTKTYSQSSLENIFGIKKKKRKRARSLGTTRMTTTEPWPQQDSVCLGLHEETELFQTADSHRRSVDSSPKMFGKANLLGSLTVYKCTSKNLCRYECYYWFNLISSFFLNVEKS